MATPPTPRVYMFDDFSWAKAASNPATAFQNFYYWDGHGGIASGLGRGTPRGWVFGGEPSSGVLGWTIIDLDTLLPILSPTCGTAFGHDRHGLNGVHTLVRFEEALGGPSHVDITTNLSNHIAAYGGSGLLGVSDGVNGGAGMTEYQLPSSAIDGSGPMYDIEAIVTVHGSAGTVEVWVDDVKVLNLTGKNTRNGGTGNVGYLELHMEGSGGRRSAEWRVHDGAAKLGSKWRAAYVPVASNGTYSNGTPTGAATRLEALDDAPADAEAEGDTTVALSSAVKLSLVSGAMPATALQIRDLHPQMVVKKSDGGVNTGKLGLRSGSTEIYNTAALSIPDQWNVRRLALRRDITAGNPLWTLVTAPLVEVIAERVT